MIGRIDLANIEEWEYCFDYDRDTVPNFYDSDDDNDELPTSVELSVDLNPFNSADAHGDKDHDGLDNLWEYENGTMINDNDTDHDGIDDGAEFEYWQNYLHDLYRGWVAPDGTKVNDTAVEYLKIPDVDKDNITDGKEINGWKVKIIVGYDEDNNPISKEVTLYGDPLAPYRAPRKEEGSLGDYIDSDEDNIPDIVESLLSNNSTFARFARQFANPSSEYYDLWTSYNWTIAYFFSLRNNKNFHYYLKYLNAEKYSAEEIARYITEWNNTPPHNKSCAENATKWLRDEFNPLITESMAPVITEFHVNTVYEGYVAPLVPNAKAHVVAEIRDVAGISKVRIRSLCPDVIYILMIWTQEFQFSGEETTVYIDTVIDVTEVSAVLTYNISVNATDTLGNSAEWYKEVDGPVGAFIKTVANMLRAFWNFLCEVGKVLAKAFEIIINFVVDLFKTFINTLVDLIKSVFTMLIDSYGKFLQIIANYVVGGGSSRADGATRGDLYESLREMNAFAQSIIQIMLIIYGSIMIAVGILFIVKTVTIGLEALVETTIFSLAKNIIISSLLGLLIKGLWDGISSLINKGESSTDAWWNFISKYVGISVSYLSTIISIIKTFTDKVASKSISLFVLGLTLAISGYFLDAATTAADLHNGWLQAADIIGCFISLIGLIMMIWVATHKKPDATQETVDTICPLISVIEWIVAIGGFAKAIITYISDWKNNWR